MAVLTGWGRGAGLAAMGICVVMGPAAGQAQETSTVAGPTAGTVAGLVTDPSGATVAHAQLTLQPLHEGEATGAAGNLAGGKPLGSVQVTVSGRAGRFSVSSKPGEYVLVVKAQGFAESTSAPFTLVAGGSQTIDVKLRIEEEMQRVDVPAENAMDTDPNENGNQTVLRGRDISQLPLQSDQLLQELQGLSGGDAPELFLNGFSGGQLPPRDTIREIRINQNPFSAQNDTNPGGGRIDVFTKPGAAKIDGYLGIYGNTAGLNAPNPFIRAQPSYYSDGLYGGVNGPITKHSDYSVNVNVNDQQTNTAVNAQVLDAGLNQVGFAQAVAAPNTSFSIFNRVDFMTNAKGTGLVQYNIFRNAQTNGGVGELSLAEQGYSNASTTQTLQVSNSQVLSAKVVNDTRFQYVRSRVHQDPVSGTPAVIVQGSFNGGGSNGGRYHDNQDRYELQNYVSAALKTHYFNFGARLRATRDANQSSANYNGQYIFNDLAHYQIMLQQLKAGVTDFNAIRAAGGGPAQYSQTVGNPAVAVTVMDGGLYFQDDWKVRKNVTLSPGMRFETQNQITDHADFAPRLGVSYSFDAPKNKPPVYVLRGGVGAFYRRFTSGNVLQAARQNGVTQQQYVVNPPNFFDPARAQSAAVLAGLGTQTSPTIYRIGQGFQAPYQLAASVSLQRSLGKHGSLTATYLETRGVHNQLTRNVNAPEPGTNDPMVAGSGIRPLGGTGNIYEYQSGGVDRGHRFSVNTNLRFLDRVYMFGNYQFQFQRSNTSGGFPSNQYNLAQDYGRTNNDVRHQLNLGGNVQLPLGFTMFGYIRATSGAPFNITLGQDLNGDSQFNDRPTFATDLARMSVVKTAYGNFDTAPLAGQQVIPINYANGPSYVGLNVEAGKTFHFGPVVKPPAGEPAPKLKPGQKPEVEHLFALEFSANAQNIFNHVNYAAPVGTLNSTLFGQFTGIANGNGASNRVISVETFFHF